MAPRPRSQQFQVKLKRIVLSGPGRSPRFSSGGRPAAEFNFVGPGASPCRILRLSYGQVGRLDVLHVMSSIGSMSRFIIRVGWGMPISPVLESFCIYNLETNVEKDPGVRPEIPHFKGS
jgi:hypothetical protein